MTKRDHVSFLNRMDDLIGRLGIGESLQSAAETRREALNRALGGEAVENCPPCLDGDQLAVERIVRKTE